MVQSRIIETSLLITIMIMISRQAADDDNLLVENERTMEIIVRNNPSWLMEGDIAMTGNISKVLDKAVPFNRLLWPNGIVNYKTSSSLSNRVRSVIGRAIAHCEAVTCLKFFDQTSNQNFPSNEDHIDFANERSGCFSNVGRIGGRQLVNLENGCGTIAVVVHEIGHAVGLFHEQSRTDRDTYVRVLNDNIQPGRIVNFNKGPTRNLGVAYDYTSIMHYSSMLFTKRRFQLNTLISTDPNFQYMMGTSQRFTFKDQKILNTLYACADNCNRSPRCRNGGFKNKDCKCVCRPGANGGRCQNITAAADVSPVCGSIVTSEGSLATPAYPTRATNRLQRSCVYQIRAPQDHRVRIKFNDFQFSRRSRASSLCNREYVEVRLRGRLNEGKFYCDQELNQKTLESEDNELLILIDSYVGFFIIGKGFNGVINFIPPTATVMTPQTVICGINKTVTLQANESVTIVSRNFGDGPYPNNHLCRVVVKTEGRHNVLMLRVKTLELEFHSRCRYDNLQIIERQNKISKIFCGVQKEFEEMLNTRKLMVRFKTDYSHSGAGFMINLSSAPKN